MSNVRQGAKLSSAYVVHDPVDLSFDEPSRTRQEFADECDINVLMRKFEATGVVSHFNTGEPRYLDLGDGVPDLREAIDLVRASTEVFMALPAGVRAKFDNDPVSFVDFASDAANNKQLVEWGLAVERKDPPPQRVEVVSMPADVSSSEKPATPPKP